MAILIYFIWSLALRLRRRAPSWQKALAEELFVLGILSLFLTLLPQIFSKPILSLLLLMTVVNDALLSHLGLALRPEIYPHFLRPAFYLRSAAEFRHRLLSSLFVFLAGEALLIAVPSTPCWPGTLLIAFGLIRTPRDHFLLLTFRDFFARKKKGKTGTVTFPNEESTPLCQDYPLLRSTRRFLGEKRFNIRIDPKEKPHVIFCFLESFRSKSLPLAPNFQALSKKGIYFSEFYANSNLTYSATIASLFGIPASMKSSYHLKEYADLSLIGLPKIFKDAGYQTALIQGSELEPMAFGKRHSIETVLEKNWLLKAGLQAHRSHWGVDDEAVFRYSADWLAKQEGSVFLSLSTITNHYPWILPSKMSGSGGHPFLDTFAYTDYAIAVWMRRLEELGLLERSIIFFLGDHGQGLGEHDPRFIIRRTLYEEDLRVPLLIYAPGRIEKPMEIQEPCSQIDLLPTVLDLFDFKVAHHSLGASLVRKKKRFLYFSSPANEGTLACRLGKWKAIVQNQSEELYDLSADPEERSNLASVYPRRMSRLKKMVENYSGSLQELYRRRALAPPGNDIHFAPSKEITDEQLARELKKRRNLFSLDLSKCSRIMGRRIEAPGLRRLDASGCLSMDVPLFASKHPELVFLNLSGCLLLTDACLEKILERCHGLEELNLQGVVDLKTIRAKPLLHLHHLNLLRCTSLDASWADWISSLPNLISLHLSCDDWIDRDFQRLKVSGLDSLFLSGCKQIDNGLIAALFEQCKHLKSLALEDCTITDSELVEILRKRWKYGDGFLRIQNNRPYLVVLK